MKQSIAGLIGLTIIFFISSSPVQAAEFSLGTWHATGYEAWRTSFTLYDDSGAGSGSSELLYPQSGHYLIGSYENQLSSKKSLRIDGGILTHLKDAGGTDSDWDYSSGEKLWWYGEFKTSGRSGFLNIDLVKPLSKNAEFFYGYGYRINKFRMTDGIYHIEDYAPVQDTLSNLDSYYTTIYQGPHIGVSAAAPLAAKIAAFGSLTYTPLAVAQGHGWWNLRSLDFTHIGPAQMFDSSIGLTYAFTKDKSLTLGYRYQYYGIFSGRENLSSQVSWDKATNIQRGLFIEASGRL